MTKRKITHNFHSHVRCKVFSRVLQSKTMNENYHFIVTIRCEMYFSFVMCWLLSARHEYCTNSAKFVWNLSVANMFAKSQWPHIRRVWLIAFTFSHSWLMISFSRHPNHFRLLSHSLFFSFETFHFLADADISKSSINGWKRNWMNSINRPMHRMGCLLDDWDHRRSSSLSIQMTTTTW